ncbi:MAG: glycosyltransferase family 4 protein [Bacteroidota bacterium]
MKILFLYSELAGYFLACAQALHNIYGCEVHLVHWPINKEAPFEFGRYQGLHFHPRAELNDKSLYELFDSIQPQLVYASGWMDKGYVRLAKKIKAQGIPVICGSDNHWTKSFRQQIGSILSPWIIQPSFSHFFVPGIPQYEFGRRLGFSPDRILTGMYSADVYPFWESSDQRMRSPHPYPHNFLYVGRYIEHKGIMDLCQAFARLCKEVTHDWTLTLVGAGPLHEQMPKMDRISCRAFVQPEELPQLALEAGCFVLPSHHEPWGVALHEFAAAGLPLITTSVCGAGTAFVRNGYNGYLSKAADVSSLTSALRNIVTKEDDDLKRWGSRSYELSKQITPESWAATLLSVLPSAPKAMSPLSRLS